MQLYNEPSLTAEWDGQAIDQQLFLDNLMNAVEQVYNAGGYVGLQFVNDDWLRRRAGRDQGTRRRAGVRAYVPGATPLRPEPPA